MKFWSFKRSKPARRTLGQVMQNPTGRESAIYDEINRRMVRMFDAAVTSNLNLDFPVSITSGNAEIFTSIIAARGRSRRVGRDNPFARNIIEAHIDDVGGHEPFRLEMRYGKKTADGEFVEDEDTNEEIEEAWEEAGKPENCCANGIYSRAEMYWQAIAALVRDGGILYRHRDFYPDNDFRYSIEPVEIDRLDHYYNRPKVGNKNEIQFSIEVNDYQRPVAYHILDRHPGDVFAFSNSPKYRTRVPAEQVITLFDIRTRAGEFVGMPRISAIIQRLHRIDQFDIAHCTAAIWTACKPLFFTMEFPTTFDVIPDFISNIMQQVSGIAQGQGDPDTGDDAGWGYGAGTRFDNMRPGESQTLPPYVKPHQMDAKFPNESAASFNLDQLRATAAGAQMPYHRLTGDYSKINFSSGRLGENAWQAFCKRLQEHCITNLVERHFNHWLQFAILSGKVKKPISMLAALQKAAIFYGRRWPYLQPVQDAQADIMRVEAKLDSPSNVIANSERGGKSGDVYREWAADKKEAEKHGLDIEANAALPTMKKGEPLETEASPADDEPPPKPTGKKSKVFCLDCHSRMKNGETICPECGSDSPSVYREALNLRHARQSF